MEWMKVSKTELLYCTVLLLIAGAVLWAFYQYMERLTSRHVLVPVQVLRVPVCEKPWLSIEDERAACAIEQIQAQHAKSKPRPKWNAKGWK
jgi:hypothetical protein